MKNFAILGIAALVLSACGGGGSTTPPVEPPVEPPVVVTPAPTLQISLSSPKVTVGTPVQVNWTSTDAGSCVGQDDLSGSLVANGSTTVTPDGGGKYIYTVKCLGTNNTYITKSAMLSVPIPVQKTSYLNAKNNGVGPQLMPRGNGMLVNEEITAGFQFADFAQDGSMSMVGFSNIFAGQNGYGSTVAGKVYFFKKNGDGSWTDITTQLISDRTGCISPRKVMVADFNADGKPDVFAACHGIDGNVPQGYSQGEHPRYLLSQPDGTYSNVDAGFDCYCHGGAAADFNNDGYADVIVTDQAINHQPLYLQNNKNGSFTVRTDKTPANLQNKNVFSLELVDVNNDNMVDLFIMGSEASTGGTLAQPWDVQTQIVVNPGTNDYVNATQTILMPANDTFTNVLDVVVDGSKIALLRVKTDYSGAAVIIYDTPTVESSETVVTKFDSWITKVGNEIKNTNAANGFSITF